MKILCIEVRNKFINLSNTDVTLYESRYKFHVNKESITRTGQGLVPT